VARLTTMILSFFLPAITFTSVHAVSGRPTNLRTNSLHARNTSLVKSEKCDDCADPPEEDLLLLAPPLAPSVRTWRRLKIVTGGDAASVAAASRVIANQQTFAELHGHAHEVHIGNYASPWIAYWHKIDVLLTELRRPNSAEVVVWMDLDVVVTNPSQDMLKRILAANPDKAIVLTEDALRGGSALAAASGMAADTPSFHLSEKEGNVKKAVAATAQLYDAERLVNTGVMLARQNEDAVRVLEQLYEYGRHYRPAAYFPQVTGTLHEQDAFNWLLSGPRKHVWRRHIAVIRQRNAGLNLNTFARSHYDLRYHDPADAKWQVGDFTAHCTGLRQQQREWCVDDSVFAAEEALAADEALRKASQNETQAMIVEGSVLTSLFALQDMQALPLHDKMLLHSDWLLPSQMPRSLSTAFF